MKRLQLPLVLILLILSFNTFAQLPKIAIIDRSDSTLIHKHLGTTVFTNASDTFDLQFNCKKYVDQELVRFLSAKYEVSFITLPDTLLGKNNSIYSAWGLKKPFKTWLASLKDKYEFVIYMESSSPNGGIQSGGMFMTNQRFFSSGLYSHGNPIKSTASVYSTILLLAYRTATQEKVDYYAGFKSELSQIKGFKFSKERLTIDPEMLPVIKTELVKLLDYKIENFLTETFLVPKDIFDTVKLTKTAN